MILPARFNRTPEFQPASNQPSVLAPFRPNNLQSLELGLSHGLYLNVRWHCWANDLPQFTSAWGHGLGYLCPLLLPRVIFSWTTQKPATQPFYHTTPSRTAGGCHQGCLLRGTRKTLVVRHKRKDYIVHLYSYPVVGNLWHMCQQSQAEG